jgi:hypothetical protein
MRCAPFQKTRSSLLQVFSSQQKNAAAAALKVEPHERELAESPSHRRLGVPHLDDQQASWPQVTARFLQNDPYGVQARATRSECDPRLMTILGRQTLQLALPYVRGVRDNNIVRLVTKCAEVVGLQQSQTLPEAMPASVYSCYFECVVGYIDSVDASARKSHRAGDGNASRAGTDVEHASHSTGVDPRGELPLDELRDGRPRDEHARIDLKREAGKPGFPGEINSGHALFNTPCDEIASTPLSIRSDALRINRSARVMREPKGVKHERRGLVERIFDPVTEENPRALQPASTALDELAYRNGLLADRTGTLASYDTAGPVE